MTPSRPTRSTSSSSRAGRRDSNPVTAAVWAAVPLLAVVAVDDLRHHRIRNRDVLALASVTGVVVAVLAINQGGDVVLRAVLGTVLAALPLLVAAVVQPGHMGGGDVKLAAVVGALLGPISPWVSLAAIAGAFVLALAVSALRAAPRVALAPALTATAVATLLGGAVL